MNLTNVTSWNIKIGGWLVAVGTVLAQLPNPWWLWKIGAGMTSIGGILLSQARSNGVPSEAVPKAMDKIEQIKEDTAFIQKNP